MSSKVIVMGGSLGGLTAALFLRAIGCAVTVFERSPVPLIGQGVGIVLNPATVRYFTLHGSAGDIETISTVTHRVRYLDEQGHLAAERPDCYRYSSYTAIYRRLLDTFGPDDYNLDAVVSSFEQDGQGVTVRLASGRTERCDLLVCADGIRSTARSILIGDAQLDYAGYVAWRGILRKQDISPRLAAALDDSVIYHILNHGHMLVYPIPVVDRGAGQRETFYNWVWYRNVPEGPMLEKVMTDREGHVRDVSLGPGVVHQETVAALRRDAAKTLPSILSELILKTDQPFIQAVMDCEVPRMAFERVCLMGDAAFVGRPHAAVGSAKAAEDAWQLSRALAEFDGDIPAALRRWQENQLRVGRQVVERNRQAGNLLQSGAWPVGSRLAYGLYQTGDSMMT